MKIYVVSDLHLLGNQPGGDAAVARMAAFACTEGTEEDVLLLLGDLGNGDEAIMHCLALFAGFPGKRLAVLGNHDLWSHGNAEKRYQFLQERLLPSCGFHSLDLAPYVHQGIAFVGRLGWYDYSLARVSDFSRDDFASQVYPDDPTIGWGDRGRVNWSSSDEDVVDDQLYVLRRHLEEVASARKIVVGMHHLPTRKLLPGLQLLVPRSWRFLNAYLGSTQFGALFTEFSSKIGRVFCGHVHNSKHVTDGGVHYTSLGGNYNSKELLVYDPETDQGQSFYFV